MSWACLKQRVCREGMKGRKYNPGQTKLIFSFVDGYAKNSKMWPFIEQVSFSRVRQKIMRKERWVFLKQRV